jgi:hypothetical protein
MTTTIHLDINLATTTLPTTTQDTTTTIDITTGGIILTITKEVLTARTTLDIIQDTTTVLDILTGIIKDTVQTTPVLIRIIPATKVTTPTTPLMTGCTTKANTTIIRLFTIELITLRKTRTSK